MALVCMAQTSYTPLTFLGGGNKFCRTSTSCSPRFIKINALAEQTLPLPIISHVSRNDFPSDFMFGAGCSSFQVEGAPTSGGRGQSIWDSFVHTPGKIRDGTVNYPGCDFYNHYEDDIKLAKDMGFDAFRFSISWTRIYPTQNGPESVEGIQYYNKLINAIINAGLTPFVTLFHWETPQYLENDPSVLGFRTKNIVPYFVKLAETCFKHFGDRVKIWATINEMSIFSQRGYGYGYQAPGRCSALSGEECEAGDSATEPYLVGHNLLLAHAAVYELYTNGYKEHQRGICGFNPNQYGAAPYSNSLKDKLATQRFLEFSFGWQLDPIVFGDYPKTMRAELGDRLPMFTTAESEALKNSSDFIGLNYYSAFFIKHADVPNDPSQLWFGNAGGFTTKVTNENGEAIGPSVGNGTWIRNCPAQLASLLEWMKDRYGNVPCYITENGVMDKEPHDSVKALDDQERIQFIKDHLMHLSKAIKEKEINVKGYIHWSFTDVFEWDSGNTSRFGLVRVNFNSEKMPPTRTPKSSATWFQKFLTS